MIVLGGTAHARGRAHEHHAYMHRVHELRAYMHRVHEFGARAHKVIETGTASFYGRWHQGKRTAMGTRFDDRLLTAAHPWLPLGSKVRVTLLGTGRSVVVLINDRMPARRRIVDLSLAAARELGILHRGIARVRLSAR